ncbi:hypothetical protein I6J24_06925 [Corynebacterium kroppenstedtii]|uniref:hypothetical protein n=1 Tax=Corynebacterium pseudokroppenstedtii TaxID=2804917 RepID=UPI0019503911|nr:hypothetical protein [Corynebacterium pseudokroppenstedtii]MDK7147209.1 hypothetical protein [Corynebacterium pseudokroppenstedtii]QRP13851.1 hypothetical protein I6J24_06925 [Corynebacterium kroppenstedtii]
MSTEIQTTTHDVDHEVEPITPVATNVLEGLQQQAQAWSAAAQIAEQLARTDFAGPFKGKPADLAAAILKGAELGIPAASIGKSIYTVHGTPSLYGKTALAIALQNGYIAETIEDTPEAVTVRMTSPKGQKMEVRYTIERATQEGLVKGNKTQYESRPSKMLYWKCIGELTDRMIPHLIGGMPLKEDVEQSTPVKATAQRLDRRGQAKPTLGQALGIGKKPEATTDIDNLLEAITTAETIEALNEATTAAKDFTEDGTDEFEQVKQAYFDRRDELTEEGTNDAT